MSGVGRRAAMCGGLAVLGALGFGAAAMNGGTAGPTRGATTHYNTTVVTTLPQFTNPVTVSWTPETLPSAYVGKPYDAKIMIAVNGGSCTCLFVNNSAPPPGLQFSDSHGPFTNFNQGDTYLEVSGIPTAPGDWSFNTVTWIPNFENRVTDCCVANWPLNVLGKKELTHQLALEYLDDVERALTAERQATQEILANTGRSLDEAYYSLSRARSELLQVQHFVPQYTFAGPDPVPNVTRAHTVDTDVDFAIDDLARGDNYGKVLSKANVTKFVNDLKPALKQKKLAIDYLKQIAAHLAP